MHGHSSRFRFVPNTPDNPSTLPHGYLLHLHPWSKDDISSLSDLKQPPPIMERACPGSLQATSIDRNRMQLPYPPRPRAGPAVEALKMMQTTPPVVQTPAWLAHTVRRHPQSHASSRPQTVMSMEGHQSHVRKGDGIVSTTSIDGVLKRPVPLPPWLTLQGVSGFLRWTADPKRPGRSESRHTHLLFLFHLGRGSRSDMWLQPCVYGCARLLSPDMHGCARRDLKVAHACARLSSTSTVPTSGRNQIGPNMNTTPVQRYVRDGPYPGGKAVPCT